MDVCQKKTRKCVKCDLCDLLYCNVTYEEISNFEKGAKMNFVSNMAFRSTVLIKPFATN